MTNEKICDALGWIYPQADDGEDGLLARIKKVIDPIEQERDDEMRKRIQQEVQNLSLEQERDELKAELAEMRVIRGIDDRFGGRLALMLECAILNPNGYFDEACALLDEYKAEWKKVNPSPPTFMGEPYLKELAT